MSELNWYQGDLHTHTDHSDGEHSISKAGELARSQGLSFIALTDHNVTSQNEKLPEAESFAYIPGMELTTAKGHVNLLGEEKPLKALRYETVEDVASMTEEAAASGAYISINHPFVGDRWHWGFEPMTYNAVELWNGTALKRNEEVIRWWQDQLAAGKRIYITGGSDVHCHGVKDRWYGKGRTYIYAEKLSSSALVSALKAGHNAVGASGTSTFCTINMDDAMMGDSFQVKGKTLRLDLDVDHDCDVSVKVYGSDGLAFDSLIKKGESGRLVADVKGSSLFYRAEVWQIDRDGNLCNPFFTNPIFLNH